MNQHTAYIYGVGSTAGTDLFSKDLIAKIEFPDKTTGSASTSSSNDQTFAYDLLGETTSFTDQNGNTHTYGYDVLGRKISDTVSTLGSGVNGSVRRLSYNFNALGLPYQQTSYSDTSGTTIVNQVQDVYNGFGQLVTEYQAHGGAVNTSSSPQVNYTYALAAGASRLSSMTYPSGRVLHYGFDNSALDNAISRVDYLADDNPASGQAVGIHLQDYSYLGLGTIVQRTDGNGVALTYKKQGSESTGDAGDQYTGLDRFGRVVDQRWIRTSNTSSPTDRFQYGYDADGNVLYKNNLVNSSFSELYHENSSLPGDNANAYDKLNRLTAFRRGTLSASSNNSGVLDTVSTLNTLSNSQQSFTLDAVGNQTSVTTDGSTPSRSVNAQNQLTTANGASLAYDNDGNTTTDDQGHTLVYDAWNRQVQVKNGATVLTTYSFDAAGRRIIESPGGTASDLYFSSAGQVIEERQSGAVTKQNVWGLGYVNDLVVTDNFTSAGALHPNFGSAGLVSTPISTNATAFRDLIQPDGKIVAIGTSGSGDGEIVRYKPDGTLDTGFGTGGIVTISGNWLIDGVIQSDGKIIAVGAGGGDYFVTRLDTDGSADTTFGSGGVVHVDFGASEYAMGVALAPDGKIVVTGPTISSGGNGNYAVARLNTNGTLDTSFNSTGMETLDLGNYDIPNGVIVQNTGKIVLVGASGGGAEVVRFNANGGVDTSFGGAGTGEVYEYGYYGFRMNIVALSDDRILVAGSDGSNVSLHRYSADGIADSTFGTGGVVITDRMN